MLTLSIVQEGVDNQADNTRAYKYTVRVNYKVIEKGSLARRDRADTWPVLVQAILDQHVPRELDQIPP